MAMSSSRFFLFLPLLLLGGCAGVELEPADDQWDRPQEAMPGIFTGDRGEHRIGSDDVAPATSGKKATASTGDYREFRQWQAWQKARSERSADYQEFLQWLEFRAAQGKSD